MPSDVEFDRAVVRIEESVRRLDDTVTDTVVDQEDGGRDVGVVAQRASYNYRVVGDPEAEYFTILFPFSIVAQLAGLLSVDDSRYILEEADEAEEGEGDGTGPGIPPELDEGWEDVSDEELSRRAAVAALERVSEPVREEFVYYLVVILSAGGASYSLQTTANGVVSGFDVSTKLFPFESGFGLSEFDRRVESVVTTGIGGLIFVNQAFDFQSMVDTADLSGMLPWYIH